MKLGLTIVTSLCAHSVAVSAFSSVPLRPRIASSYDRHRLQPTTIGRKNVRCSHSARSATRRAQALSNDAATDSPVTRNANSASTYYKYLLSQFQGDFDNYNQVVQDRVHGLTPGEGGGHEHIHCTLVPCPQYNNAVIDGDDTTKKHQDENNQWVLAAFYFNGNPLSIFRFRLYQLIPPSLSEDLPVRMELNTLLPHLEQQLRKCSDQPGIWWKEVWNVWCKENNNNSNGGIIDAADWNELQNVGMTTMTSPLEGCDVLWDPNWDTSKHSYLYADEYVDSPNNDSDVTVVADSPDSKQPALALLPPGQSYHATMEAGSKGAIVDSISLIPGKRILIKDELSLWKDEFWINDRGYDPDVVLEEQEQEGEGDSGESRMPFVYGNRRGVPYKLQRVSNFVSSGAPVVDNDDTDSGLELGRTIANSDLEWTLGEDYRTPDVFERKMEVLDKQ